MTSREQGFLLLTSQLGDSERKPLTTVQLRELAKRVRSMEPPTENRDLVPADLMALGYSREMVERILTLLAQGDVLEYYIGKGHRSGCVPITRVSAEYPTSVRAKLGLESPGCLWAKGDISLLDTPCVALVGSRDLHAANQQFAREIGLQAALQGYTLVSGNARGADRTAQEACLAVGGRLIIVVADRLEVHSPKENVLYLSEDSFDAAFTTQRALSRNRVIHSLGSKTFVAQCSLGRGGTWDGTTKNLRYNWSEVFCCDDGSEASRQLEQQGALLVSVEELGKISDLHGKYPHFFDQ